MAKKPEQSMANVILTRIVVGLGMLFIVSVMGFGWMTTRLDTQQSADIAHNSATIEKMDAKLDKILERLPTPK
jgi:preprotein translocase subunit SecG